jgi:hypothetical protein
MKGHLVPILIREQGIGRGEQPITWAVDWRAGAGGDPYTSYASVPHYLMSEARSLFLENYEYSTFDLREDDRVQVGVFSRRHRLLQPLRLHKEPPLQHPALARGSASLLCSIRGENCAVLSHPRTSPILLT